MNLNETAFCGNTPKWVMPGAGGFVRLEQRATAVQESGNGGEMVRTKRARATKACRQGAKRDTGEEGGVMADAAASEILQERQGCALAKVLGNALLGDATSIQLSEKMTDDTKPAKEPEPAGNGFSQAAVWEAEPAWPSEASEETAETVPGGREPEN